MFLRRERAQGRRMNTLMPEQIYCNLDSLAYDSDDLEYTSKQLVDRASLQACDYYDVICCKG